MTTRRRFTQAGLVLVGLAFTASAAGTAAAATKRASSPRPGSTLTKPVTETTGKTEAPVIEGVSTTATAKPKDDGMTLHAGDEGTVFKTLTIEGEDRIRLDFGRPRLEPSLDFGTAPGLDLARAPDVLSRSTPDPMAPLLARSAGDDSPYLARPWLTTMTSGPVARIRPEVDDVDRWRLTLTDSRGQVVAVREGKGKPPQEIPWNGMSDQGRPLTPGITYSHLFEAWDRAGNRRRFVGEGFRVSACRLETPKGSALAFGGAGLGAREHGGAPPLLLEAASWVAQLDPQRPIRITATARTRERAEQLTTAVTTVLAAYTPGPAARLQPTHEISPDAPEAGAIRIETAP